MIEAGELSEIADKAEEVLRAADVQFFERANELVRPIVKAVDAFHGRQTSVAQLTRVGQAYMRDMLCRVASWRRFDRRAGRWVRTNPPHDIASTILARAGEWTFPTVAGVITTQTMRPDGTILDKPGYDSVTRLLLVNPPAMAPLADNPTKEEALAALELLDGLLAEFPFVDDVSRSVALSALITPVVRGAFAVAPMFVADAPVAGSGKSYLFDIASSMAIGQAMPVIAAGRNEEETEKRLGAAVMAAQPLIAIDNVNGELAGDALCQIAERPRPQVRILGKSELIEVEARTTLFANGNNITIVGDLCRRVIRINLDPRMEQPELRVFNGNPVATVMADRGAYVRAALTICRAYAAAGRPDLKPRLGSYEGWSDTVRSALTWLGRPDPVDSMGMVKEEDPNRAALVALLDAWAKTIGTGDSHSKTLKEVVAKATEGRHTGGYGSSFAYSYPELRAAVLGVVKTEKRLDPTILGYWMREHKNRLVNDMRFEKKNTNEGVTWWVARSDGKHLAPSLSPEAL
jgi:putative DNA primase/helicase